LLLPCPRLFAEGIGRQCAFATPSLLLLLLLYALLIAASVLLRMTATRVAPRSRTSRRLIDGRSRRCLVVQREYCSARSASRHNAGHVTTGTRHQQSEKNPIVHPPSAEPSRRRIGRNEATYRPTDRPTDRRQTRTHQTSGRMSDCLDVRFCLRCLRRLAMVLYTERRRTGRTNACRLIDRCKFIDD